jgi:hypothetical protein
MPQMNSDHFPINLLPLEDIEREIARRKRLEIQTDEEEIDRHLKAIESLENRLHQIQAVL